MTLARLIIVVFCAGLGFATLSGEAFAKSRVLGPGSRAEVVSQSPDGFELRVTLAPPLREEQVLEDGASYARVSIPGFQALSEAGRPALPLLGLPFAIPPGHRARIEVEAVRTERFTDYPPLPAVTGVIEPGPEGGIPTSALVADPSSYRSAGLTPATWATLGPTAGWRYNRIQTINLTPVRAAAATGVYEAARELIIRVRFEADRASASSAPSVPVFQDRVEFESLAEKWFLNAETARRFRHKTASPARVHSAAQSSSGIRLRLGGTGFARISQLELQSAGLAPDLPLADVRVEERFYDPGAPAAVGATPIPRTIEDNNGNGLFDAGDHLVFFGYNYQDRFNPGFDTARFSHFHTYWVSASTGGGVNFSSRAGFPAGTFETVESFPHTVRLEEEETYINFPPEITGGLYPQNPTVYWFGPLLGEGSAVFKTPGLIPDGTTVFTGVWQGAFLTGLSVTHRVSVDINANRILDSETFSGLQTKRWTSPSFVSGDLLTEGDNVFTYTGRGLSDEVIGSGAYFDFLTITYDRELRAEDNELQFSSGGSSGDLEFVVTGFTDPDIVLLDITNPVSPVVIDGLVEADGNGYRVRFRDTVVSSPHRYHAAVPTLLSGLPPSNFVLPPDLADSGEIGAGAGRDLLAAGEGSDIILVTHPQFLSAWDDLVDLREEQGHRVLVCDVFEIYDQFAGGNKTPWAIQRFINEAFKRWPVAPTYLLLGGDASEDYRRDTPRSNPDWVPTMMHYAHVPGALRNSELAATDTWFVSGAAPGDLDNDFVPDMFVGRLPVGSLQEALGVALKIVDYEDMSPEDDWRSRGVFLADDAYSTSITGTSFYCWSPIELSFSTGVDKICDQFMPAARQDRFDCIEWHLNTYLDSVPQLNRNPGSGDCPRRGDGQPLTLETTLYTRNNLTEPLFEELSRGHLIWSYTGHANKNQMTTEGLIIHRPTQSSRDLDRLNNFGKPFIFHGFACHLAEFEHATEGDRGESIGEVMLLAPNRGAIASIASTGYEWAHLNESVQLAITAPLFWSIPRDPDTGRPIRILSQGVYSSLIELAIDNGFGLSFASLLRTYAVLGDPALKIDFHEPGFRVSIDGEPVEPGTPLVSESLGDSILVTAVVFDDTDISTIRAIDGSQEIPSERIAITPPAEGDTGAQFFDVSFKTVLRLGTYDLALEATDWNGRTSRASFPVVFNAGFSAGLEGDFRRLEDGALLDPAEVVRTELTSPVPLQESDFTVFVDGEAFASPVLNRVDDVGRRWTVDVDQEWPGGSHAVRVVTLKDGQTVEREIGFQVSEADLELLGTPYCYPNPAEHRATALYYELNHGAGDVQISIYTVSGRRVLQRRDVSRAGRNSFEWDLRDERGDEVANGVYLLVLELSSLEGVSIRHMERLAVSR